MSRRTFNHLIMGVVILYGVAVRDAILTNDIEKMKAVAKQARQTIKEQGDLSAALIELEEAIAKLEESKK